MDSSFIQSLLFPIQAPWLPDATIQRWALPISWGVVLGTFTFHLLPVGRVGLRAWLAMAVAAWMLLPGGGSPSYWLGLAFQSPSLMSTTLCLLWSAQTLKLLSLKSQEPGPKVMPLMPLVLFEVVLGWVLLGDMLALWHTSIYAWGFGTGALVLVAVLALVWWCFWRRCLEAPIVALTFILVLGLFVVTRLPSGNLWDALIDPWLWLVLQFKALRVLLHRRRSARCDSRATPV